MKYYYLMIFCHVGWLLYTAAATTIYYICCKNFESVYSLLLRYAMSQLVSST